ncbi:MAG: TonB-dependent receptor [Gammaproteobacteria bacterium]|nr:TonB-dependent receptor [Gammaproteobacteria bacterium]
MFLALWIMSGFLNFVPVWAEEEEEELPDYSQYSIEDLLKIVIYDVEIATGDRKLLTRTPSVVSVITMDDIESMGAADLSEVLETVPGLHVARLEMGYLPVYTVRGVHSVVNPELLMLVNGIPIKHLYLGNRGEMGLNIPVNTIARIEIIRGPGSAVFGADAFSGVINIFTKTTKKVSRYDGTETGELDGMEIGLGTGSFDTREGWLTYGGSRGGFDAALILNYRTTEGQQEWIDADAQSNFDASFGTDASLAPGPLNLGKRSFDTRLDVARKKWRLRAAYQGVRNMETGAGNLQALDPNGLFTADRFTADLTYHDPKLSEHWDVTAQVSYMDTKSGYARNLTLLPPGAMGGAYPDGFIGNPGTAERHTRFDISGFYSGFSKHKIRAGTGYHYGDLHEVTISTNFTGIDPATGNPADGLIDYTDTPYSFLKEGDRRLWYLFVQNAWMFSPDWEFTSGLRYDEYSDFGTTLNPRLALIWKPRANLTVKALYGHAFLAPSFSELYFMNNPVALGNPDVDPATIETWELAVSYLPVQQAHFSLNLFSYKIRDAVRYMPVSSAELAYMVQNAGSQKGCGLEFSALWRFNWDFSILANYARQQSIDGTTDRDAGNSPHYQLYIRGKWRFLPEWHFNVQTNWVAGRRRVDSDPRPDIDDYATVDLIFRYKNQERKKLNTWNFTVSVRNVFDENAREPSPGPDNTSDVIDIPNDFPLAGRNYFVEARYHF